jgi:hypothetical protein
MTEAEWLACEDVQRMLSFHLKKASPRKLRLLCCAACRRVWDVLAGKPNRTAIEVAELYADGAVPDQRRADAYTKSSTFLRFNQAQYNPAHMAAGRTRDQASEIRKCLAGASYVAGYDRASRTGTHGTAFEEERAAQCGLAREIFGDPFQAVTLDPALFGPDVTDVARAAYEDRVLPSGQLDPTRLAVLADALQEAGCADTALLSHLRSPGPHVRGCWALDLILGKQ